MSVPLCDLSVSCVIYQGNQEQLIQTLDSLIASVQLAKSTKLVNRLTLALIDNGPADTNGSIIKFLEKRYDPIVEQLLIYSGHGNIGYGAGHNLALLTTKSTYHLVLNPDVIQHKDNISIAIKYMNENPSVGLLVPDAFSSNGMRQFIAKRQPKWYVLISRALNVKWLNNKLKQHLDNYEYRDSIPADKPIEINLASGCYMFLRAQCAQYVKGFDKKYFMYFEDFDLSNRVRKIQKIIHHPQLKIIHFGGDTAKKGIKHQLYFVTSYTKYILNSEVVVE